jgi:biotin carboxyl carrier protein
MVTALHATLGSKVASGEKLATLEAMKMQTTLYAHADGIVDELLVAVGDAVEAGDLLAKIRG